MARLALNKSTLHKESQRLKAFRQFVPALDLKRRQLMSARQNALAEVKALQAEKQALEQRVAKQLPMLTADIQLPQPFVKIRAIELRQINLVGLHLTELASLDVEVAQYSRLQLPHCVDELAELLKQAVEIEVRLQLVEQRLEVLEEGLRKTTQRLNLFDKVLIPRTIQNIRKIGIALSDAERAGVVRAKIAKNKRRRLALS